MMEQEIFRILAPALIILFIMWLIYRITIQSRIIVTKEIYKNFPYIKGVIDDFERRIEYLKGEVNTLERKIKELNSKTNNKK
jgi:cell division protein FtsB